MGLFDLFGKKKQGSAIPDKKTGRELARLARLVESKLSQNYDRQEAIEVLSRMATAESASVLLKRFNWSMDPSITDQDEKESAARGISAAGEKALDPIRQYCRRAESLTWPLKVLKDIVPEERLVEELLGLLDQFDTEYVRNPEPKIQLIATLEDYPSEEVRIAVEPFLGDTSEPVRFAAATTVFALRDEASVPALIAALEEEESLRVKNRIAQGLAERGWVIPEELRKTVGEALPDDFRLVAGKVSRPSA
jgi:HEAT repeat protein